MGNVISSASAPEDIIGESEVERNNMASKNEDSTENQEFHDAIDEVDDREERVKAKETEMEEFRHQLQVKREQRREILDRHKAEKKELEVCLANERKSKLEAYESNRLLRELLVQNNIEIPEHLQSSKERSDISDTIVNMKEEFEKLRTNNNMLRRDLADANVALQGAYSDIADLHMQNTESMKHINALKEVVAVSKTMLSLRENQLDELKSKLSEIERSLADREASMLSSDLRQEYERQLQNIRNLRTLYEERARLAEVTRQGLMRELEEQKALKQAEMEKVKELTEKVQELETSVDELQETLINKNNQIYMCQDETRGFKAEMSAVNKLFSHVLLGYKNKHDLDKLVHRLEENHGILTHMAENENDLEASTALPKLLLEIVSQVDEGDKERNTDDPVAESSSAEEKMEADLENPVNTSAEEIVQNLPKVWRVLIELLSQQAAPDDSDAVKVTTCYKTVETKSGPVEVPSVSQTYIRLKDLIVEKLGLVKEVNRMKQLNVHLETRLEEQERRLCLVTNELSKTWHVVGRLRKHHHQLHTHEKILKYELQQKRKLLNELKEELEYCREKWDQAREKNTQSEKDWRKLRAEFTSRNTKSSISFNNSAESGYSDERPSDESSESNDESEYVTEPQTRSKKKLKKSFETVLDSSTDRNLAAEREDPVSDMLDVADLPLDTQDGEDHHNVSSSFNSESLLKSERVCETEDEVGDITHDSCTDDNSVTEQSQENDNHNESKNTKEIPCSSTSSNVPTIDAAAILKSIKEQNERLAKKDKKLEKLEKTGAALLQKTQTTAKISNQIINTLDHILSRPSSSKLLEQETFEKCETSEVDKHIEKLQYDNNEYSANHKDNDMNTTTSVEQNNSSINQTSSSLLQDSEDPIRQNDEFTKKEESIEKGCVANVNSGVNSNAGKENTDLNTTDQDQIIIDDLSIANSNVIQVSSSSSTEVPTVDFKAILENAKKQNEILARKDKRLEKLETGCSEVVKNISKTVSVGDKIIEKLDNLHISNFASSLSSNELEAKNITRSEFSDSKIENLDTNPYVGNVEEEMEDIDQIQPVANTIKEEYIIIDSPSTSNEMVSTIGIISDNVKLQNELLTGVISAEICSEEQHITNTSNIGEELPEKSDLENDANLIDDNEAEDESTNTSSRDSSEPSTSSEVDHKAIFAARDLRLKRLEEQTKSLVKKVNKTTDKGVKIHYKLEELHNIYGSESSRAGTPSDNEERDRGGDDKNNTVDEKIEDHDEENCDDTS